MHQGEGLRDFSFREKRIQVEGLRIYGFGFRGLA
jgi:hypothetical protein